MCGSFSFDTTDIGHSLIGPVDYAANYQSHGGIYCAAAPIARPMSENAEDSFATLGSPGINSRTTIF